MNELMLILPTRTMKVQTLPNFKNTIPYHTITFVYARLVLKQ